MPSKIMKGDTHPTSAIGPKRRTPRDRTTETMYNVQYDYNMMLIYCKI